MGMKIYLFEHLCGGGMRNADLPPDLVTQGQAMLEALATDFIKAGHHVVATIDWRITLRVTGIHGIPIRPDSHLESIFDRCVSSCDTTLIIAPEMHGLLTHWTRRLAATSKPSLGCQPSAVALCSDKLALSQHLQARGLPTPPTDLFDPATPPPWPAVIKPRMGAGCKDTFICANNSDFNCLPPQSDWILQPRIPGVTVSVSFISHDGHMIPLLAGHQQMKTQRTGPRRMEYCGGDIPLPEPLSRRAIALACRTTANIPGLNGFLGVDLILGTHPDHDYVMEINPRITLSYIALRKLCTTNLAMAMINGQPEILWSQNTASFDAAGRVSVHNPEAAYGNAGI